MADLLAEKFERLRGEPDAGARGAGFEAFLGELFGREHFRVQRDFVADGRQIDVFVMRDRIHLLIEAKWTKRRSQHDVIDEMRARLQNAAPDVMGLVVSMSGFTKSVIERVERSTERPILLMDGAEVAEVVRYGGLYSLIQFKRDELVRNRRVFLSESSPSVGRQSTPLPEAGLRIIDLAGRQHEWWESRGEFAGVVNPLARPDTEWVGAGSVSIDFQIGCQSAGDVVAVLRKLAQLGWISGEGSWRIEQRSVVWAGLGPAELARQLEDWEPRYRGRRMHHSETATYVDSTSEGMLVLTADVSASQERVVRWCELSFMLEGTPLDLSPYHALLAELPVLNTPHFRIVVDDPTNFRLLGSSKSPKKAKVRALVVREPSARDLARADGPWVVGLVAQAPMSRRTITARTEAGLPGLEVGDVFVNLRQHHLLGDSVVHLLHALQLIDCHPAKVLHLTGDWEVDSAKDGVWPARSSG